MIHKTDETNAPELLNRVRNHADQYPTLAHVACEIASWKRNESVTSCVTHQLSLVHLEPAGDARQTLDQRQRGPLHPQALRDRTQQPVTRRPLVPPGGQPDRARDLAFPPDASTSTLTFYLSA